MGKLKDVTLRPSTEVQTLEAMVEELRQKGMEIVSETPDDRPWLPKNISDMNGRQLGELLMQMTSYRDYVGGQYAIERARLGQFEHELDVITTNLKAKLSTGKLSEAKKKQEIQASPEYISMQRRILNQKNKLRLIEAGILDSIKRDIQTVSRLISIWETEIQTGMRANNVGKRKKPVDGIVTSTTLHK